MAGEGGIGRGGIRIVREFRAGGCGMGRMNEMVEEGGRRGARALA